MGVDDPITQPTNRGNKLRINAEYVHEGALGFTDGVAFYRKVRGKKNTWVLPLRAQ